MIAGIASELHILRAQEAEDALAIFQSLNRPRK